MTWRLSILRSEQYKALQRITFMGKVLDLGGTKDAVYHRMINGSGTFLVGNISPASNPDILFDAQKPFPLENESFDNIVCLNVLEHVYDYKPLLTESYRVLKSSGSMVASTPFMYRLHGSPDDFFRYTPSALKKAFTDAGFREVVVTNLGKGPFSIFWQSVCGAVPTVFLRTFFQAVFVGIDTVLSILSSRYKRNAEHLPLGLFVVAKK